MNYRFIANIREEAFGAIIYNKWGAISFVDKETRSFIRALRKLPMNSAWLIENCPDEFKNKLQEFLVWGLRKGYIEVDHFSKEPSDKHKLFIERSIHVDVFQRLNSPITATLYPEYRCNQHCYFCFAQNNMKKDTVHLDKLDWEQIIDSCLAAQITRLVILGGEPFINMELLMTIIRKATPFIPVTVFTNGTVGNGIDLELAQELAHYTNVDLVFSIHSSNPSIHDFMTGVEGAHRIAMQSLKNVCDIGANIASVNCVMTAQNVDGILELAKKLEEIGVRDFAFTPANPCGLQDKASMFRIAPGKVLNVYNSVREWLEQIGSCMEITCDVPYATGALQSVAEYSGEVVEMLSRPCVGDSNIIIDFDGGIYACNGVVGDEEFKIGNIKSYDIKRDWKDYSWPLAREKNWEGGTVCKECEKRYNCYGGCPLLSMQVLGNAEQGNPFCYKINP